MKKIFLQKNNGSITLEILIAFSILIINITAVMLIISGSQSMSIDSQTNREAITNAENWLEQARFDALSDFSSVISKNDSDGFYTRNLIVISDPSDPTNEDKKLVTSNVSWNNGGKALFVKFSTLITNFKNLSNTCNSTLVGDWTNPQMISYALGSDIIGDTSSGYPITSIAAAGKKLYVTVSNTNGNNFDSFYVLDVSNQNAKPSLISSIDNDPLVKTGLNDVTVFGKYAYVASASSLSRGQLQVIDISTNTPQVVKTFKIPGVTGSGGQGLGLSIFYKSGIIYLGLTKAGSGPEFNMIDIGGGGSVGASPTNPVYLGGYDSNNGINAIYVKGHYAYIATPNNQELTILNISNPTNINSVGGFDAPGGSGNGKSLAMSGNNLYLGRTVGGNEFYILDDSNPETILPSLGSKDLGSDSVNGIIIRNQIAFLLTNTQVQILNIQNPGSITQWATPLTLPSGSGSGLGCTGNYLYVGSLPSNDKGYISIIRPGPIALTNFSLTIHNVSHNEINTSEVGSIIHNSAIATGSNGTPTGSVDFTSYTNSICTTGATSLGNVALVNGTADPSNNLGALAVGTYYFKAHYNGDISYESSDSACQPLTIIKITPSVTTEIHDLSHAVITSIGAGATVHNKVTIEGSVITPTGNVNIKWYTNDTCASTPVSTSPAISISAGTVDAVSFLQGLLSVGLYSFQVHYNGDVNYLTSDGLCEPLTVIKATPTLSTTPSAGGVIGGMITDNATLLGGYNPTSVTFKLYNPLDTTCSGVPAYSVTDGVTPYTASYVSDMIGVWHWATIFAGDANNNSVTNSCSDAVVITKASPTISTVLSQSSITTGNSVNDTAILTNATQTAGGTVTYTFYSNNTCSAGAQLAGIKNVTNKVVPNSNAMLFSTAGTYYWQVVYSGDANNNGAISNCTSEILIVNNPPFTYSISNPGPIHLIRGTPLPITITLSKLSGVAVPVLVSVTSLPGNATLSNVVPTNSSCTPNSTCTVTFTFTASSNAKKSSTSIINGNPAPISTQSFSFTVN